MASGQINGDDRDQHEHAADEGVQKELDRGVKPVGAAPDADQEIHRDQHGLPEDVEEEKVEGREHADHCGLEDQHGDHELPHPVLDSLPGHHDRNNREQRGQRHKQDTDTVDAEFVIDVPCLDPLMVLCKLHGGGCCVEIRDERYAERQLRQRKDHGDPAHGIGIADEQQDERAGQRQQDQKAQHVDMHIIEHE